MRKLTLKMDDLRVDSFTTSTAPGPRGTVQAHATEAGPSCEAANTCGPETCGNAHCILDTQNMNLCGTAGTCPGGSNTTCPPSGAGLSCAGCTTYDYTANAAHDSCGFCMSFESDAPQRCRCI